MPSIFEDPTRGKAERQNPAVGSLTGKWPVDPDGAPQPPMRGCHQPSERFKGTIIPFAWFAKGLRILDIADPFAPKEIAFFEPDPPEGFELASSNDVTMDSRGLLYLIDRQRGVDIVETSVL